jgi:L-rhamnose mutarotase
MSAQARRVCFLLKVKSEHMTEYRERHAAVWPEMLAALSKHGWTNYSLFLKDDGLLIGYLVTEDYAAALTGMASEEVNARWQAEMGPFFVGLDDRRPDEGFLVVPEVFHLD